MSKTNKQSLILYKRDRFVRLGNKIKSKHILYKGKTLSYPSDFIKPTSKFWKRVANKKVRKNNVFNGSYYKKLFGWFDWS